MPFIHHDVTRDSLRKEHNSYELDMQEKGNYDPEGFRIRAAKVHLASVNNRLGKIVDEIEAVCDYLGGYGGDGNAWARLCQTIDICNDDVLPALRGAILPRDPKGFGLDGALRRLDIAQKEHEDGKIVGGE